MNSGSGFENRILAAKPGKVSRARDLAMPSINSENGKHAKWRDMGPPMSVRGTNLVKRAYTTEFKFISHIEKVRCDIQLFGSQPGKADSNVQPRSGASAPKHGCLELG